MSDIYELEQYDYKITVGDTFWFGLEFRGKDNLPVDLSLYHIFLTVIDPETEAMMPMAAPASIAYSLRCRTDNYGSDDFEGIYRFNDARGDDFIPPDYVEDMLDAINKIVIRMAPDWTKNFKAGLIYPFDVQLEMASPSYGEEKHTPLRGRFIAVESRTP